MQLRRPPRGRVAILDVGTGAARITGTEGGTTNDDGTSRNPRNNRNANNRDAGNHRAMTMVWWIYPPDDEYQHATIHRPPRDGGSVRTLCKSTMDIGDRANVSLNPHRPHCPECVGRYLSTPEPFPVWSY